MEKRIKIQFFHEHGWKPEKIAKELKISRTAVRYNVEKFKKTQKYEDRPRSGRKKLTTNREDRILERMSVRNRRKSSKELAAQLNEDLEHPISARTVRQRLLSFGLRGCKARKKPWLSDRNQKRRYEWAKKHANWTVDDWKKIVWSDEANVQVRHLATNTVLK